jgi:predicted Zn-dependent protease
VAFYALNRLNDADTAFANALKRDPHDMEASQMRGLTLFRLGRPADAIPFLESAPGTDLQTKADPSYVLALCYIDTRRYDDARHAFAAQFGLPGDSASSYLLAARMLLRREYLPVAQRFAMRASELDPHLPLVHELLGEIALAQNHLEESAAQLEQERAANPLEPSSYERLGDVYSRAGRYPEARRTLQQAVLLAPNSTAPYILLGKVTLKEGDAVAAITYLQKAEHMDPANYMTHNLLAQAYRALGRTDDAARELQLTQKIQAAAAPKLTSLQ